MVDQASAVAEGAVSKVDGNAVTTAGYYSLIKYRRSPARDEGKNIGVVFADVGGEFARLRVVAPHRIGATLTEHGLLDAVLAGMERRLRDSIGQQPLFALEQLSAAFRHSLLVSAPRPAADARSPGDLLESLYQAFVAPAAHASPGYTKGHILDRLARWTRLRGAEISIATTLEDFMFDAILHEATGPVALYVSSFAARHVNPTRIEQETTHFLFASERVEASCVAVIQPPAVNASDDLRQLHGRVVRWLDEGSVSHVSPAGLRTAFSEGSLGAFSA